MKRLLILSALALGTVSMVPVAPAVAAGTAKQLPMCSKTVKHNCVHSTKRSAHKMHRRHAPAAPKASMSKKTPSGG